MKDYETFLEHWNNHSEEECLSTESTDHQEPHDNIVDHSTIGTSKKNENHIDHNYRNSYADEDFYILYHLFQRYHYFDDTDDKDMDWCDDNDEDRFPEWQDFLDFLDFLDFINHYEETVPQDIIPDDDDNSSKNTAQRKFKTKSDMTTREYRKAAALQLYNKYRCREFDSFATLASTVPILPFLQSEYKEAIYAIAEASKHLFTLYDIICYTYINIYGDPDDIPALRRRAHITLSELVTTISYFKYADSHPEVDSLDIDDNNTDRYHFNIFNMTARRTLEKYFDFIFDTKSSMKKFFQSNGKIVFNVTDYPFISRLLAPESYHNIHLLTQKKFDQVSSNFYLWTYLGMLNIVECHNVNLTPKDITSMWTTRFHAGAITHRVYAQYKYKRIEHTIQKALGLLPPSQNDLY